jgi:predicted P-loop ATPase/GTPase
MTLSSPFKSVEDLKNISEDFRKTDKLKNVEDGKKEENPMGKMFGGMDNTKVSYKLTKYKFSRKISIIENE